MLKFADLGLAKEVKSKSEKIVSIAGSLKYFSPEMIRQVVYDMRTDVFSLGCVIYELCALRHPFTLKQEVFGCPGVLPIL